MNRGAGTGAFYVPYVQTLYFIADLDAAHAFDTFCRITDQWEILIPRDAFNVQVKRCVDDI